MGYHLFLLVFSASPKLLGIESHTRTLMSAFLSCHELYILLLLYFYILQGGCHHALFTEKKKKSPKLREGEPSFSSHTDNCQVSCCFREKCQEPEMNYLLLWLWGAFRDVGYNLDILCSHDLRIFTWNLYNALAPGKFHEHIPHGRTDAHFTEQEVPDFHQMMLASFCASDKPSTSFILQENISNIFCRLGFKEGQRLEFRVREERVLLGWEGWLKT